MECINQNCFDDPALSNFYLRQAKTGMLFPGEAKLNIGKVIYRFGSSDKPYNGICGSWWMSDETYFHLRNISNYHLMELAKSGDDIPKFDVVLRNTARAMVALLPEYTLCDILVRAELKHRLRILVGRGRYVEGKHQAYNAIGTHNICQFFIPGFVIPSPADSTRSIPSPEFKALLGNYVATPLSRVA